MPGDEAVGTGCVDGREFTQTGLQGQVTFHLVRQVGKGLGGVA